MKIGMLVLITDVNELQNLLDDFGPTRPELNVYSIDGEVWANSEQLHMWRNDPSTHMTRAQVRAKK